MKLLENWSKWLPILTVVVIMFGDVYLFSYYRYFNINLFDYISPADVLSLFFSDLLSSVVFLLFCSIFGLLSFDMIWSLILFRLSKNSRNYARLKGLAYYHRSFDKVAMAVLVMLISLFCLIFLEKKLTTKITLWKYYADIATVIVSQVCIVAIFGQLLITVRKKPAAKRLIRYVLNITPILMAYLVTSSLGEYKGCQLLNKRGEMQSFYKFSDTTIQTNDTVKFVGTSDKYIFFYVNKTKRSQAFVHPKDDLKAVIQTEN